MRTTALAMAAGLLSLAAICVPATHGVADDPSLTLELKDHKFQPANPTIPANTKVKLTVKNLDATPAEFESEDIDVEKVIPGNSEITVNIGPLEAGTYEFYDEYHEDESTTNLVVQ
ncbi:MAG TPA: cupredoxin domain-containing protein [Dongiaceae bacterium]